MFRITSWVKGFFGFSRTETNAFLLLLPLMIVLLFSEPAYRRWNTRQQPNFFKDQPALDSMIAQLHWIDTASKAPRHDGPTPTTIHFKTFDPNKVEEKEFIQLGVSPFMARRIVRYRGNGGVFRTEEDMLKIYGIDTTWYEKAKPWIAIAAQSKQFKPKRIGDHPPAKPQMIDINLADSLQLLNIYGIGPALSKRIRTFRSKLGGFVSLNQLHEVYGLDSSVVMEIKKKFIVADNFNPQRLNLNTATLDELRHPYLRFIEAQAIIAFRLQHGNFNSIDQLTVIKLFTPEKIEKLRPYVTMD